MLEMERLSGDHPMMVKSTDVLIIILKKGIKLIYGITRKENVREKQ